jgi:hypothetical protein
MNETYMAVSDFFAYTAWEKKMAPLRQQLVDLKAAEAAKHAAKHAATTTITAATTAATTTTPAAARAAGVGAGVGAATSIPAVVVGNKRKSVCMTTSTSASDDISEFGPLHKKQDTSTFKDAL